MWQDTVIARSHGFADVLVFRLPRRMVLLCRSGSRRSTSVKNSEPVTNAEPVRGPVVCRLRHFFSETPSSAQDVSLLSSLFSPPKHHFWAAKIRTFPSYLVC